MWLSVLPIVTCCVGILARGYESTLALILDDAFLYFVTAENFVRSGRSTFDNLTTTTGYHPLWFLVDSALIWACGLDRRLYMKAFIGLCLVLAVVHAFLLGKLFSRLSPSRLLVECVTAIVIVRSLAMSFTGMESALTLPLMVWLAILTLNRLEAPPTPRLMAGLGLAAAVTALARIDAILFGVACGALVLLVHHDRFRETAERAAAFAAGLAPFAGYLCVNWLMTGALLTTSAQAKALRHGLAWNPRIFEALTNAQWLGFVAMPAVASVLVLSGRWPIWRDARRFLFFPILGFPLVYYATLAFRSDWQLWYWYLYPLPLCMGLGAMAFGEWLRTSFPGALRASAKFAPALVAAFALESMALAWRVAREGNPGLVEAAEAVAEFGHAHPGRYAMGDRSGLTSFILRQPVLQLEGLVADQSLLEDIRAERSLPRVLAQYGIDYLIEAVPTQALASDRCQPFSEPKPRQSGEHSPKMHGTFCDPLLRYDSTPDAYTTLVYAARSGASSSR
jgi:hypothetical protein